MVEATDVVMAVIVIIIVSYGLHNPKQKHKVVATTSFEIAVCRFVFWILCTNTCRQNKKKENNSF